MSIIVLFPSLLEITLVQYLFDGEGRGNDKVVDGGLVKHFEMFPKAPANPVNTPSSP